MKDNGSAVDLGQPDARDELVAQLRQSIITRTEIGIALGVVMTRLDVDRDAAFQYLRRLSSQENRKLHTIAAEIAASRSLPE